MARLSSPVLNARTNPGFVQGDMSIKKDFLRRRLWSKGPEGRKWCGGSSVRRNFFPSTTGPSHQPERRGPPAPFTDEAPEA